MKTYEYKEVTLYAGDYYFDQNSDDMGYDGSEWKSFVEQLNIYGAQGWTVVQLLEGNKDRRIYLLQRELMPPAPYRG